VTDDNDRALVPIEIRRQGRPIVNAESAYIAAGGVGCAAIYIDMRSKRCEVFGTGSDFDDVPTVDVEAVEGSLHLDESKEPEEWTEIAFPTYKGWRVFSASASRYTLAICLIAPDSPPMENPAAGGD
jgi:hypothetical protein